MKHVSSLISTLLLVAIFFSSKSIAQDYVHYKTLNGHNTMIICIAFSSDGRILASGSLDKTIRLWDVSTGKLLHTLTGHKEEVHSVSFDPDGRILASGSLDKTIRLWDASTGKPLHTLTGHKELVYSVSFSPDGKTIASGGGSELGSGENAIFLWNVATGKHLKTLIGHTSCINTVSFSPDGKTIASGSGSFLVKGESSIRLWDTTTGTHLKILTKHTWGVRDVCFSSDGKIIASTGNTADNKICLWDAATGAHLKTLISSNENVYPKNVTFSPNSYTIASSDYDGRIHFWGLSSVSIGQFDSPASPKPTANQIYEKAIRSVMWIVNPGTGEGSGVLIDKKSKLAITNAHVTGKQDTIDVYFPAPDEKGELIKDRNFYLTSGDVLKRLGYYTKGHIIAKNEKTDLAIIRLDGLPETARQIDWKLTPPTTKAGELVYILGNPAKQDLWRWTLGEFLNDHGEFLHIQSNVFGGNSGGPVLNKQGILLGIVARSDQLMNAAAIPARHINRLLSESKVKHSRMQR